jgi:hypothetical protein
LWPDHSPSSIENDSSEMLEPPEWQRIGNQINAAMICARANFVNVH